MNLEVGAQVLSKRAIRALAALLAVTSLSITGCGSSSSRTYDETAFRACIESNGAQTASIEEARSAIQSAYPSSIPWDGLVHYMPGGWLAAFTGGEVVVFDFGPTRALDRARSWIVDTRGDSAEMDGNMLALEGSHPTKEVVDVIQTCKGKAQQT